MKRRNLFGKVTLSLVAVSMSMFLFAGCQSSNNNGASQTTSNNTQSSTQNSNKPSAEQRKKQMQDNIQPLITAGTITQDQANKILDALTTPTNENGQNKSQDNQQGNQQNNNQNNSQNKPRNNRLAKLVSDGVITQAQADAVMQKIRGNATHKNNGQGSQNNSNQSSN